MDGTMSTKQEHSSRVLTGGSRKGKPNKVNRLLKDAILDAAHRAGQHIVDERYAGRKDVDPRFIEAAKKEGMTEYLQFQAEQNPTAFMSLMGKVLPMQVKAEIEGEVQHVVSLKWRE
jgi:hypothetical protein